MTKQVSGSKQNTQALPENIKERFESIWGPITQVRYCGIFITADAGRTVRAPTFAVNEEMYIYVHNAEKGTFQCEMIIKREERQKKFGEQVHWLMDVYGFTWGLGKVIVKKYPISDSARRSLCEKIQEAKNHISYNGELREQFSHSHKRAMLNVIYLYDIDTYLNPKNRQVYEALKEYWFAVN